MIPFLFTMWLCALVHPANAQEITVDDVLPEEQNVKVLHLPNGVKTYIQEHQSPHHCASFKIIVRNSSSEQMCYAFDSQLESLDCVEQFFQDYKEKALDTAGIDEVTVIAVGDFAAEVMENLIEKHFGSLALNTASDPQKKMDSIQIGVDKELLTSALVLSYPHMRTSIRMREDLQQAWKFLLLQDLFQQRMERCMQGIGGAWIHSCARFFLPTQGYALTSDDACENLLSFLLWQVESMRIEGFSNEEFSAIKRKLLGRLQYLSSMGHTPDSAFLASYYADQVSFGEECLERQNFFETSLQFLEDVQLTDLVDCMDAFFQNENRFIRVVYPKDYNAEMLTREKIEDMFHSLVSLEILDRGGEPVQEHSWKLESPEDNLVGTPVEFIRLADNSEDSLFELADAAAPDFVIPSPVAQPYTDAKQSFYALPLSEKEKSYIYSIITTIGSKNILQLAFERKTLERKGKKINHVHPLRFVGYILSNHDLRTHLKSIKKSMFKWDAFISGFSKRMREEHARDNINLHVPGFAHLIGTSEEHVHHYIHKKDFEGLVKSLL